MADLLRLLLFRGLKFGDLALELKVSLARWSSLVARCFRDAFVMSRLLLSLQVHIADFFNLGEAKVQSHVLLLDLLSTASSSEGLFTIVSRSC